MNESYFRSSWSNYGNQVNFWAPGEKVVTNAVTSDGRQSGVAEISGTSTAAPYVAGILATFYGYEGRDMYPGLARKLLGENAERGVLRDLKGGPNVLANNGFQKAKAGPIHSPYIGAPIKGLEAKMAAPTR